MKRYNPDYTANLEVDPEGEAVLYADIAPLLTAVDNLLKAKGRYHTEQNYKALAEARAALEKAQ